SELDQFAYVVSHDLKAPIRGISHIISWIEEDHASELTSDIKKNHALIKGRIARLESMIDGLLTYARIGRVRNDIQEINIGQLLGELAALLVPAGFEVVMEHKMPFVTTEKLLIEQVFSNLISNAVKYNDKPEGRITISFRELAGWYEFSVSDNGKGIEQVYFEKIFIIFQTLQERDAFESTGVGLAIVKKIIEDKKGKIIVSSEPGKGSVFTFTWPKFTG
ncbi:MAG: sensor histidine kinase, partial [Bacteroidia bacterium]